MSDVKVERIKKNWREFFREPVFGKAVWETDADGKRHYTRAEAYELPLWPEPFVQLVEIHEQGHLDGLPGQSWPVDVMWEGPGRLADTIWEKFLLIFVGPAVVLRRIFTGSWFCSDNCEKLNMKALAG